MNTKKQDLVSSLGQHTIISCQNRITKVLSKRPLELTRSKRPANGQGIKKPKAFKREREREYYENTTLEIIRYDSGRSGLI